MGQQDLQSKGGDNAGIYSPQEAMKKYANKSKDDAPKRESDSEKIEKYGGGVFGTIAATIDTEINNKIDSKIQNGKNVVDRAKEITGNDDNEGSDEEEAEELTPEEQEAAEKAEAERMEQLQKEYIVNAAVIKCDNSPNMSYAIIPVSHGEYIQGKAQLNIEDCKPNTNIVSFKTCQSTENPKVREAAKKVLEQAQDRTKGFMDRVMDLFAKPKEINVDEIDDELVKQCAAECECWFDGDATWIDGKEDVLIDGKPALLGKCSAMCGYGGNITFYTSGQEE